MATGNLITCLSYPNVVLLTAATFIPIWIWFEFLLSEDPHPEPRPLIYFAIFLGFLATILSYYSEASIYNYIGEYNTIYYFYSALIEELFKFLVIFLFIFPTRYFDEEIDAMIYMGFSALGFSFIETFANLCNVLTKEALSEFHPYLLVVFISILRFLGANFLHILASAIIGFGYALTLQIRRIYPFIISFVSAIVLHFIYNLFIIKDDIRVYIFPILWAVFFIVLFQFAFLSKQKNGLRARTPNKLE